MHFWNIKRRFQMEADSKEIIFSKENIHQGLTAAWPVCLGYAAVGLAFGVLARKAGLTPLEVGLMSLFVYAGSSQFIAAAMIGGGAGIFPVVLTTFVVNLRHLLMSSSLSVYLRELKPLYTAFFAYGVTDESFAVNAARFRQGGWNWQRALLVNHISNMAWIVSTIAGSMVGNFVPDGAFGIDYALTAMFICLLIFQIRDALHIVVALLSGIIAVSVSMVLPGNYHVIIASFTAATIGLIIRRKWVKTTGEKS
jgi:4-azaleucine resistance transporter AzlC